tara:strand:+ start:1914 stop:2579 length:666 start_codon:yes stop_codon:yes gene_type:complete
MARMATAMASSGSNRSTSVDDTGLSFCSGTLHIQRRTTTSFLTMKLKRKIQTGGEWKDRFCVLKPDGMYMYREQDDPTPTQIIWMKGAKAEVEKRSETAFNEKHVFRLEASRWEKNGKQSELRRTFIFAATSKSNMDNWVYMTRYVIESIDQQTGKKVSNDAELAPSKQRSKRDISGIAAKAPTSIFQSPTLNWKIEDPETLEGEVSERAREASERGRVVF